MQKHKQERNLEDSNEINKRECHEIVEGISIPNIGSLEKMN